MKVLIIFAFALTISEAVPTNDELLSSEWSAFKVEHRKQYVSAEEENLRFQIYVESRDKVAEHNKLFDQGLVKYKQGLNQYSDMSHEEFLHKMTGYKRANSTRGLKYTRSGYGAAEYLDWREHGYVTPVKNQYQCGSCWSFSATGALEGANFKRSGQLVSLSEQNLLDCAQSQGCDGGSMEDAFAYVIQNGGVDTEMAYQYEAQQDYCRYSPYYVGGYATNYYSLPSGDEYSLLDAVSSVGPISIAMDASLDSFQYYQEGIYYDPQCSSYNLDHGVLLVGYGSEYGTDYWLVKNSWGETWGESGYFKLPRNYNNHCGVASDASYPVV